MRLFNSRANILTPNRTLKQVLIKSIIFKLFQHCDIVFLIMLSAFKINFEKNKRFSSFKVIFKKKIIKYFGNK